VLFLGFAGAVLWQIWSVSPFARVISEREMEHLPCSMACVGYVPAVPEMRRQQDRFGLLVEDRPQAKEATKAVQLLESRWKFMMYAAKRPVLAVTSLKRGAGVSMMASNLAMMSSRHRKTLLIDANIQSAAPHVPFHVPQLPGFSDAIVGDVPVMEVVHTVIDDRLWVMPAGTQAGGMGLLQHGERLNALMDELARKFDAVIIDFPSLEGVDISQYEARLSFAGAVLMVLRKGQPMTLLRRFTERYREAFSPRMHVVLNESR